MKRVITIFLVLLYSVASIGATATTHLCAGEEKKCKCGSEAPIVKEIIGRKLDYLYTSDGAKINGGNIANIFKSIPNAII
ncbi:MAG: hypothetical protein RL548_767, partial [Bacteroidota bacterium]